MKHHLFLRLSQYRSFWRARRTLKRVTFSIASRAYETRKSLDDAGNDSRSLWAIVRVTAVPLIFALLAAVVLQGSNRWVSRFFNAHCLRVPDDSDYVTFLAAISSIGGVFIGLYYAAVATVASSIYARVPANVRDLLAQDRFGIVYMRFLAFVTYLCITLICFRLSSFPRVYLAAPIVTIASGIGVFAFVRLGQRVLHLFDPAQLSSHVFEQLQRWVDAATAGRFKWSDEAFQHHAYKQAARAVDVLETLRDLLLKEPLLNGTQLLDLSKSTATLLVRYSSVKNCIPSTSRWYRQIYAFPEWYRTDDMTLSIATETGTTISPKTEINRNWLEERLTVILLDCLTANLVNAQWENAVVVLNLVEYFATSLAERGHGKSAFEIYRQACSRTLDVCATPPVAEQVETVQKIALAESLASIPIALSLALRRKYESLRREEIASRVASIDWSDSRAFYAAGFEDYALGKLEYLAPRLAFERAVEGAEISPNWYLTQLVLQPEAEHLVENVDVLVSKIPIEYAALRTALRNAGLEWMAAATLSRQWEYWHKLDSQVSVWELAWTEIEAGRTYKDLPWPTLDLAALPASLHGSKVELLKAMSELQSRLGALARPTSYPDYAGQFLHFSGEAVLEALIDCEVDVLLSVVPKYFAGCLAQFVKMRSIDGQSWLAEQNLRIATAAVLDLMDVSGYSLLLSEIHEKRELWTIVRSLWDRYLADGQTRKWIVALVEFVDSGFSAQPRDILRIKWQRKVEVKLAQVPNETVTSDEWRFESRIRILHPSALVREVAGRSDLHGYDGITIFVSLYLARMDGAKKLADHWERNGLSEHLSEERYDFDPSSDVPNDK